MVVYSENGNLRIPKCKPVKIIEINEQRIFCYKHVPILYQTNKTLQGFLTPDRIIRRYSKSIKCDFKTKKLFLPNINKVIITVGNKTWLDPNPMIIKTKLSTSRRLGVINEN